jgi:hypothetical protein
MGLALILIGIVVWLLVNSLVGIILVVCGLLLLFVPGTYGYRDWGARRGPP